MMALRMTSYIYFTLFCYLASTVRAVYNFGCVGGTVYIIAHPDDDLLFQSPDLANDVASGGCITTIVLTSGDSGAGPSYSESREAGNDAAYAYMAGSRDNYTDIYAPLAGQSVLIRTLRDSPRITRAYFRLPDGGMDGNGYEVTGYESIRDLYFGVIGTINDADGDTSFTLATLKQALGEILTNRKPVRVRALDHLSNFDAGDHADHIASARIAREVASTYAPNAAFAGYMGYPIANLAPSFSSTSASFNLKSVPFFNYYVPNDPMECTSYSACSSAGRGEASWLLRQYAVTPALAVTSTIGTAQTPAVLPSGGSNVASLATVTASAFLSSNPPFAAIDGNIGGYPGNSSAEWDAPDSQVPVTFTMSWGSSIYNITSVVLYDRPNLNDWVTGGTLTFSDDSVTDFGALYNDGSATVINLQAGGVLTSSILLTITDVAASTSQLGLSEFAAFGVRASANATIPSTTVPAAAIAGDRALEATATASSDTPGTGQTAAKAIDGVINGYSTLPGSDYTKEWASGQTTGVTLTLTWRYVVTVSQVILYDRPNLSDQITGGTLTFSDGSSVAVPSLDNAGAATVVNLAKPVNTTSLVFRVTSVSSSTGSAGLAEIQVFSLSGGTTSPSGTSSTATSTATSSAPTGTPTGADLALSATAVASSQSDATGQTAAKAIDSYVDGYKEDGSGIYSEEWASGTGVGTTLKLTWPAPVTFSTVVLYDRPNLNDQMTGGTLTFSTGATFTFGALNNDGSATVFSLPSPVTTTTLLLTVTSVSSTTSSVGLSEIEIYAAPVSGSTTITGSAPTSTSNSTSTATRSGSSSAPTATPGADLALSATATASSQSSGTSQTANKAIDGVINGYTTLPGSDYTKEWASGVGVGATLTLTWSSAVTISQIVLYDRPNLDDQVTGATLTFGDGTSVSTGALFNDGSATVINLASPVKTSTLQFYVTSVSDTTGSAGLAEIQVYGSAVISGGSSATPTSSGASSSAATSSGTATSTSPAPSATPTGLDLALSATAVASSQSDSTGQTAAEAIDSYVDGYKEDGSGIYSEEWASGTGVGTTLKLTWPAPVTFSTVVLYDRPNLNDQMTGGTLTFSTGATFTFGALNNDGSATVFSLPSPVTTTTLLLTVTSVSSTTSSVGLSEIELYAAAVTGSSTLASSSSNTSSSANVTSSAAPSTSSSVVSSTVTSSNTSSTISSSASSSSGTDSSSVSATSSVSSNSTSSALPTSSSGASSGSSSGSSSGTSSGSSSTTSSGTSSAPTASSGSSSGSSSAGSSSNSASVSSTVSSSVSTSVSSSASSSAASVDSASAQSAASVASASSQSAASVASSQSAASVASASSQSAASVASSQSAASVASASQAGQSSASIAAASSLAAASSASAASVSRASVSSASSASVASASSASVASVSRASASAAASMVTSTRSSSAAPTSTGLGTAPTTAATVNIARLGRASASSFRSSSPPSGVNDGIVGGSVAGDLLNLLGNPAQEWATGTGTVPAWVQLDFTSKYLMKTVYLFAPVNTLNSITAGTLTFSDGSKVAVKSVSSSGTAVNLGAGKTVSWVRFTITATGLNLLSPSVGLAEMKIFNAAPITCGLLNAGCLKTI